MKYLMTFKAIALDTFKIISNHFVIVLLSWLLVSIILLGTTSTATIWGFVIGGFIMMTGLFLSQYLSGDYNECRTVKRKVD